MTEPYPELSWSVTRQRLLERCPRAYYFHYYQAWGGWRADAPAVAREAYRLKRLTTLDQLLGLEIDARGRELEKAARAGEPLPSAAELEDRTLTALRAVWRASAHGRAAFLANPRGVTMLRVHYFDEDAQAEVDRLKRKVGPCLRGLLAAAHWPRLRECGAQGCVPIPDFAAFPLDGVQVFAAPDLAYAHAGCVRAVDWKSGREDTTNELQVLLQLRLLEETPALAPLPVVGHLEYLNDGTSVLVEPPGGDWRERVAAAVRAGVAQMRALLADAERNAPLPAEAFGQRRSALCARCVFRPLCG